MGHVIRIALMLLLATESISALPQGDGLASATIPSSSVNPSEFSWISTWATKTSGTESVTYTPYLDQQSQSQATHTGVSSSVGGGSRSSITRVVVPIIVAVFIAAVGVIFLIRLRKQRALRAHRRKSSWIASNKYKWQPNQTKAEVATDEPDGQPPLYPSVPTVRAPHRASTHERKTSIL